MCVRSSGLAPRGPRAVTRCIVRGRLAHYHAPAPDILAALLNDIGIPTTAGRTAAIRQHVLEMAAPVVAEARSYHRVTTAKLASEA